MNIERSTYPQPVGKHIARSRALFSMVMIFSVAQSSASVASEALILAASADAKAIATNHAFIGIGPSPVSPVISDNFAQAGEESEKMAVSQREVTPALVGQVEKFLREQFAMRGIDSGLLQIVLKRIAMEAAGEQEAAIDIQYPTVHAYPSVAQQISWQYALIDIAREIRRTYPAGYEPRQPVVQIESASAASPPSTAVFLWRVPQIVEGAQGGFSLQFAKSPIPSEFGSSDGTVKSPVSWAGPLRIAPTGVEPVDTRISAGIKRLRLVSKVSGLDSKSFPSKAEIANVFLPQLDVDGGALDRLWFCANASRCVSLADLGTPHFREAKLERTDSGFFRQIYLLNPYGGRSSASAVVKVDAAGQVIASFAGALDLGYVSLRSPDPAIKGRISHTLTQISRPFDPAVNRQIAAAELSKK